MVKLSGDEAVGGEVSGHPCGKCHLVALVGLVTAVHNILCNKTEQYNNTNNESPFSIVLPGLLVELLGSWS